MVGNSVDEFYEKNPEFCIDLRVNLSVSKYWLDNDLNIY